MFPCAVAIPRRRYGAGHHFRVAGQGGEGLRAGPGGGGAAVCARSAGGGGFFCCLLVFYNLLHTYYVLIFFFNLFYAAK